MANEYEQIYSRNIGFFTEAEQEKLRKSTIGIAGVGGVGSLLAERLIRLGIGQIKITDPGYYEQSNLNRQYGSSMQTLGKNKAEVVFSQLEYINPEAKILWSSAGIKTEGDVIDFVKGCDLVIDEMDMGMFKENILLQKEARKNGIYYFFSSSIGFGSQIVIFDPQGMTLSEYNGLPPDVDVNKIEKLMVPSESILTMLPSYFLDVYSEEEAMKIVRGEKPGSAIGVGAGLAAILAAFEAINILLQKRDIICAPAYTYIDLYDRRMTVGNLQK